MGFEPTISTLGKLHVDPYTKPARIFPHNTKYNRCRGRCQEQREECLTASSNVRRPGSITAGSIVRSIADILREVFDLRGFAPREIA